VENEYLAGKSLGTSVSQIKRKDTKGAKGETMGGWVVDRSGHWKRIFKDSSRLTCACSRGMNVGKIGPQNA